jgi:uncharacterized phage protein (TIGR02216 family)
MSFPWALIMRAGLGQLRLPPEQFWRMTLKELAAALARPPRADGKMLRELMNRYPDAQSPPGAPRRPPR